MLNKDWSGNRHRKIRSILSSFYASHRFRMIQRNLIFMPNLCFCCMYGLGVTVMSSLMKCMLRTRSGNGSSFFSILSPLFNYPSCVCVGTYHGLSLKQGGEQIDDRIVEVHWEIDHSRWRMMRFRNDKPNGNHLSIVDNIIQSIADGVEKEAVKLWNSSFL